MIINQTAFYYQILIVLCVFIILLHVSAAELRLTSLDSNKNNKVNLWNHDEPAAGGNDWDQLDSFDLFDGRLFDDLSDEILAETKKLSAEAQQQQEEQMPAASALPAIEEGVLTMNEQYKETRSVPNEIQFGSGEEFLAAFSNQNCPLTPPSTTTSTRSSIDGSSKINNELGNVYKKIYEVMDAKGIKDNEFIEDLAIFSGKYPNHKMMPRKSLQKKLKERGVSNYERYKEYEFLFILWLEKSDDYFKFDESCRKKLTNVILNEVLRRGFESVQSMFNELQEMRVGFLLSYFRRFLSSLDEESKSGIKFLKKTALVISDWLVESLKKTTAEGRQEYDRDPIKGDYIKNGREEIIKDIFRLGERMLNLDHSKKRKR